MFILLLFACAILSTAVIFPLYYFAVNFQGIYSLAVSILALAGILFIIIRQVKKHGAKAALSFTLKFIIIAAGLSSFFVLVIHGKRIPAFLAIPASAVLYALMSKILKSKNTELSSEKSK